VNEATIDDKVRRQLRNDVRFGWLHAASTAPLPLYSESDRRTAFKSAVESMVLLKNEH
jgi:beta-glucosidase-like glycosyl hydrolase